MTSSCPAAEREPVVAPLSGTDDVADLAALVESLRAAERNLAKAVLLAGRLAGSGACERIEGLPLEHYLGLAVRLTGADRRMV